MIAEGTPEGVAANPASHTGRFLAEALRGSAVPVGDADQLPIEGAKTARSGKATRSGKAAKSSKAAKTDADKNGATRKSAAKSAVSTRRRKALLS